MLAEKSDDARVEIAVKGYPVEAGRIVGADARDGRSRGRVNTAPMERGSGK
jgi:hypothetical protein